MGPVPVRHIKIGDAPGVGMFQQGDILLPRKRQRLVRDAEPLTAAARAHAQKRTLYSGGAQRTHRRGACSCRHGINRRGSRGARRNQPCGK